MVYDGLGYHEETISKRVKPVSNRFESRIVDRLKTGPTCYDHQRIPALR